MQHLGTPEEAQAKDAIERLDAQLDSLRQERTEARRTYGAVIEQFEYLHKVLANEAHATSVATTAEAVSKAKSVVESAQATIEQVEGGLDRDRLSQSVAQLKAFQERAGVHHA
jgi:chromosome segregation ATPase